MLLKCSGYSGRGGGSSAYGSYPYSYSYGGQQQPQQQGYAAYGEDFIVYLSDSNKSPPKCF